MRRTSLTIALLFLLCGGMSLAQQESSCETKSEEKSLADLATKKPGAQTHAKVKIDEDTLPEVISKGKQPIPDISFDGLDNSDDILKAINEYKLHHTPEETEAAVKDWWEHHDELLRRALDENREISERRQDAYYYPRDEIETDDYRKAQQYYLSAQKSAQLDQRSMSDNFSRASRIQQGLIRVRNGLLFCRMHYDWFKIRNGNGNGSF